MGSIPPSRALPWHPTHRSTGGTPDIEDLRAYSWQYWHGILLIPACTRWLNGIGCSTSVRGAQGRCEKTTTPTPLRNRAKAIGINMRFGIASLTQVKTARKCWQIDHGSILRDKPAHR